MKLNEKSYVHVKIRGLCLQLELLSDMKMITNLDEEFQEIRFIDKLGYIIIDYNNEACFILSHRMDPKEWQTVQDIILYCNWLEAGKKVNKYFQKTAK